MVSIIGDGEKKESTREIKEKRRALREVILCVDDGLKEGELLRDGLTIRLEGRKRCDEFADDVCDRSVVKKTAEKRQ